MPMLLDRFRSRLKSAGAAFAFLVTAFISTGQAVHATTYTSLHDFNPYAQGSHPHGSLVLASDGKYYGTTQYGGQYGSGAIFRIDSTGTWTTLYSFAAPGGVMPSGSLVQGSDGALYGTTIAGGVSNGGVIFRFVPATGSVTVLHTFGGTSDLLIAPDVLARGADGALYGASSPPLGVGGVFRCTISGAYSIIHTFTSEEGNPAKGGLYISPDGYLYGETISGGDYNHGIVYQMTSGGVLTKLHDFENTDGLTPLGSLTEGKNGMLWGTTRYLGANYYYGTIFQLAKDGSAFKVVHDFTASDGFSVAGPLFLGPDGNFYGCAHEGGPNQYGDIFRITAGGVFSIVHPFSGSEGASAWCGLIMSSAGALYGTTESGGSQNAGTVFKITTGGTFTTVHSCVVNDGAKPDQDVVLAPDGNYYGVTQSGGTLNHGTIFRLTPTARMSIMHTFTAAEGNAPTGLTIGPDGNLYGATSLGTNGASLVFRLTLSGVYQVLHTFTEDASGPLTLASDGKLYGVTQAILYSVTADGTVTSVSHAPHARKLAQAGDGYFYGLVIGGGYGYGSIIRISPDGGSQTVYSFTNGKDGFLLDDGLATGPDGNLYGVSDSGGYSTIFRYNTTGSLDIVAKFNQTSSRVTIGLDGTIYGVMLDNSGNEMLYTLSKYGEFSTLASLPTYKGTNRPDYTLHVTAAGLVYGVDSSSGAHGNGAIFTTAGIAQMSFGLNAVTMTGGKSVMGTITLASPAPQGGRTVTITSSNSIVTPPKSVTIPAGAAVATFAVPTSIVRYDTPVTVTATSGNIVLKAALTVKAPVLTGLTVTPNSLMGGQGIVLTATISSAAPAGGITVNLTNSSKIVPIIPGFITIPAGATSASIKETVIPVDDDTTATITGSFWPVTKSTTVTVHSATLLSVSGTASVYGGTPCAVTVKLTSKAGPRGVTVSLASSDGAAIPAGTKVTIPSGATSVSYTAHPAAVVGDTAITISGTLYFTTRSATIAVKAPVLTTLYAPASVSGGSSASLKATLSSPAPDGGLTVMVTSNSAKLSVGAGTIAIAAGATSGSLSATTIPVDNSTAVTVTAKRGTVVKSTAVTVMPPVLQSMTVPNSAKSGTAIRLQLVLTGKAGPSGIKVALSSSDGKSIPAGTTATAPASYASAAFTFTAPKVTANTSITITASEGGVVKTGAVVVSP